MKDNWAEAAKVLDKIDPLPFCGISIRSKKRSYHISPFKQISISGVGPVFFLNKNDQKIYTALQRRFQDNFQW
ncbi:MAG: hypothetical protein FJX34_04345, partial [Alphaproteobacteria bacterium]|nr:hypothetical protein [Alphaproteobacteria bacterium]